jgi:hypothetical protein
MSVNICSTLDSNYYNNDLCNQVATIINSTTEKPTIVNPDSSFVIVTYWWGRGNLNKNTSRPCPTEDNPVVDQKDYTKQPIKFEEMIDNWKISCKNANCNYLAVEYPEFAVKGGYQLAINAKPLFIKKALELCDGRAVVYIDGDMVVHKYPHIFDIKDYDYMARHWNIDPRSTRHFNKLACFDLTTFETSGGIMYFNDTNSAKLLLDKWISYTFNKQQSGKADDRIISLLLSANKKFLFNIKMLFLPIEFLWLTDKYVEYLTKDNYNKYLRSKKIQIKDDYNIENDIIIEHPECLTLEEIAQKQGADTNRAPRLYETLVGNKVACSKYGGYLWEYILFENKLQLEGFKSYLTYIKTVKIEDIYEEEDEDEKIKSPYTVINYDDKYGSKFNKIAINNKNYSNLIKIKLDSIISEGGLKYSDVRISYQTHETNNKKLFFEYDATKNYIYTNYIAATIIALFELDRNAIYIPDSKDIDNQYNIRKIQKMLKKNNELELLFVNRDAYLNIDKINILKVPIYFKRSRVLYNILHLINNEYDFIEIFQKILKSSQLFIFSIRISLYKTLKSSDKTPENKKEQELFNERKDLLNRFRTKLLNQKKSLKFKEDIKKSKSAEIKDVKEQKKIKIESTKDECLKWKTNKLVNPKTNRKIEKDKATYNKLKKDCDSYKTPVIEESKKIIKNSKDEFTKEECLKWKSNKLVNPRTNRKIEKDKPTYNKLNKLCDKYK